MSPMKSKALVLILLMCVMLDTDAQAPDKGRPDLRSAGMVAVLKDGQQREVWKEWRPCSRDIKDVVRYCHLDWATFRNGGFRELSTSTWNSGYRVTTDSHMTGDFRLEENSGLGNHFVLGGSVWFWDTRSLSDNHGIEHGYWYDAAQGSIVSGGNTGGGGHEQWYYCKSSMSLELTNYLTAIARTEKQKNPSAAACHAGHVPGDAELEKMIPIEMQ
ncbi:hypothetical protein OS176_02485 [Xanthomonadaceae bacterium XH05]|nr:hypothetical protein [Xanthomonadaceae bacterium XH05]